WGVPVVVIPVRTRTVMVRRGRTTRPFYALRAPRPPRPAGARPRDAAGPGWIAGASVAPGVVQAALKVADLALGPVLLPAVALLQLAGQVFGVALGHVEHVVGEVAPLGLHLALQLLPVAGDDVAVH